MKRARWRVQGLPIAQGRPTISGCDHSDPNSNPTPDAGCNDASDALRRYNVTHIVHLAAGDGAPFLFLERSGRMRRDTEN